MKCGCQPCFDVAQARYGESREIKFLHCGAAIKIIGLSRGWIMTSYVVSLRQKTRSKVLTIEAKDALVAALRDKHENPDGEITYVRKYNRRGDHRHPHEGLPEGKIARP